MPVCLLALTFPIAEEAFPPLPAYRTLASEITFEENGTAQRKGKKKEMELLGEMRVSVLACY